MDRKNQQRKAARERRAKIPADERGSASARMAAHFSTYIEYKKARRVALYWPVGSEADPRPIVALASLADCEFCLPVVTSHGAPLSFRAWHPGAAMEDGAFGIPVPADGAEVEPDFLIIPLVGFDRGGYRLGQGGGFYDQTLAKLRSRGHILGVGLAFSSQECLNMAREPHDERLDWILTEDEAMDFTGANPVFHHPTNSRQD